MVDSSRIAAFSSACVLAVGLRGCGTTGPQQESPPLNVNNASNTQYVQANTQPIKMNRCAGYGIDVQDAAIASNVYPPNSLYWMGPDGMANQIVMTGSGAKVLKYMQPAGSSAPIFYTAAGAITGGVIGSQIGRGGGTTAATATLALLGAAAAPLVKSAFDAISKPARATSLTELEVCKQDLWAIHGAVRTAPVYNNNVQPSMYGAPMPFYGPRRTYSPYGPY
ncbi:MAG: hypothetical protein AAB276_05075 [Pseudomonadota bacterium]